MSFNLISKNFYKFLLVSLFILFGVLGLAKSSWAATIIAASCEYVDVASAVSAASSGDTVIVPAGTATWNSTLTITKGLTLQGAGVGSTTITASGIGSSGWLIKYLPANPALNEPFRITGFTFDLNNDCGPLQISNYSAIIPNKIRIDYNSFLNSAGPMVIRGVYGVVDNNTLTGFVHFDSYGAQVTSWNNLTFTYGTADNLYYEDNTITTTAAAGGSGGWGGRYCSRYNTTTFTSSSGIYPWFDIHGNQQSGVYATMGVEAYGNIATQSNNKDIRLAHHRGGKALIFYNKMVTDGPGGGFSIVEEVMDSVSPTNYPNGQASNGQPQHVSDSYYWNNRGGTTLRLGTEDNDCCGYIVNEPGCGIHLGQGCGDVGTSCASSCNTIQENREFWNHNEAFNGTTGIGCGTLASRPATCTTGVGYWATNQSCSDLTGMVGANPSTPISGTLYKCTAPNTWTAYYTPYAYPHPIRTNCVNYPTLCDLAPDTTPPSPPTNVSVI